MKPLNEFTEDEVREYVEDKALIFMEEGYSWDIGVLHGLIKFNYELNCETFDRYQERIDYLTDQFFLIQELVKELVEFRRLQTINQSSILGKAFHLT